MEIVTSEKVTAPGAYRMSASAYHGDPCPEPSLSNGLAQLFLDASPHHVRHAHPKLNPLWQPDPHTRRTALGAACHALLLDQGRELVVLDFDDYRKGAAKEARDAAEAEGKTPILRDEHARAQGIVASARAQLRTRGLADLSEGMGDAEVAVIAHEDGIWRRCLLDWWSRDRTTLVDYKTTIGYASPAAFATHAASMGYDFQESWYRRTVAAAFPELAGRLDFLFVVQEIEPPHALSVCRISEGDMHVADRKVDAALAAWAHCRERNEWPSYPRGVQPIQLPEWHTRRWLDREMGEGINAGSDWIFAGGQ